MNWVPTLLLNEHNIIVRTHTGRGFLNSGIDTKLLLNCHRGCRKRVTRFIDQRVVKQPRVVKIHVAHSFRKGFHHRATAVRIGQSGFPVTSRKLQNQFFDRFNRSNGVLLVLLKFRSKIH